MKDIHGWIALAIFTLSCMIIGMNGFLLKNLNLSVLLMMGISIIIVAILKAPGKESQNAKSAEDKEEHK